MYDSKSISQFLFITQRSKQPVFSNPSLITLQLKLYWFSMDKLQIKIYFKTIPSLWSDVENVTLWTMPSAEFGYIGVKINLTWNPWHNSPSSNSQNKLKSELLPPWNVVNYPPPLPQCVQDIPCWLVVECLLLPRSRNKGLLCCINGR